MLNKKGEVYRTGEILGKTNSVDFYKMVYNKNNMDDPAAITYIGKTDFRNSMTKFGIKAIDRTKHMYVIGKTGTGKSTFLENMIVQDIVNGNGVAFIDPHGGSADKLLDYIPEHRIKDVIYLNPSDTDFPVGFNPLEDIDPTRRPLVVDGLMTVFKKIWPDAFSGRMEYILNNAMLALLEYPNPTLLSINRVLTDKDFRKKVIASITDPTVRNAWDELSRWDDKRWSEATGALINKVGQFTTNPLVRNIVGQTRSSFDFRKAMDERKIVIINLSKGRIGEQNQPLFGAMIITKIYLAAMSRADLSAQENAKAPPFYFYVDEFQNFANDSFANILSEARKYKLCLTVANQYVNQMAETIRDAVFGNMGTTISFRVGPLDSPLLEKVFTPTFMANDLENLQFGQYYVTLQIDNMGSRPFSAQNLWPLPVEPTGLRDVAIENSRKTYARTREDIESEINEWFGYNKKIESTDQKKESNKSEKSFSQKNSNDIKKQSSEPHQNNQPQKTSIKSDAAVQQKPKPQLIRSSDNKNSQPISHKINDLLDQLEQKGVTPNESIPETDQDEVKVVKNTEQQMAPKTFEYKNNTDKKPVNDRFAKPETKNALLEALQKAQAIKKTEQEKNTVLDPEQSQSAKSTSETKSLNDILKEAENIKTESKPEPVANADDVKKATSNDTITQQKLQGDSLFQMPKAEKEVPEEILKKLLE
jgi:hypothetical protein